MIARNFCVEPGSLLEPRVDYRGATDGRTGSELPALNWLSSAFGCRTGDYVTPWRIAGFLFALLLAASVFALAKHTLPPLAAPLSVVAFATSPLVPYFSRTTQPDMASASLAGLALLLAARGPVALAYAAAAAAMLLKLPAAVYLLPITVLAWGRAPASGRRAAGLALLSAAALAPAFAWYAWARRLQLESGLTQFALTRTPAQLLEEWTWGKTWVKAFVQWPFDVWLFPIATVALLGVLAWKRGAAPVAVKASLLAVLAHIFLTGYSGAHHDYYQLMLLPALAPCAGWALAELCASEKAARWKTRLAVLLFALAAAWQLNRARSWWAHHQAEWAQVEAFGRSALGAKGEHRLLVVSEGNPRLFWFLGQLGREGDPQQPQLEPTDDFAAVDRARFEERAAPVEARLTAQGCAEVFANSVAWVCRAPR